MKYSAEVFGRGAELSVEKEGLRIGGRFLDFADFLKIRPINHRVYVDLLGGETVEISMLGFSYDGFLDELCDCYSKRGMEALFVEEQPVMRCEGEYRLADEQGRGIIVLLSDAVCILPMTSRAVRIPLCFTREIRLEGYLLHFEMQSGAVYTVGRMGYDTMPFAERAQKAAQLAKKQREKALANIMTQEPFDHKGLFRTGQPELYWLAATAEGRCAIELFTDDDSATYLYEYKESTEEFLQNADEAMEAMGIHREIIYLSPEQLENKPLYRMSVARSEAVRFLRARSCGRLIHNATHDQRLKDFLNSQE